MLELAFASKLIREVCESEARAEQELGQQVAAMLKRRLADLRAARTIGELPTGNPRVHENALGDAMLVDLCDGFRVVLNANHPNNPVSPNGTVDWTRVRRVKVVRIEN